jgi:hypothetical protein
MSGNRISDIINQPPQGTSSYPASAGDPTATTTTTSSAPSAPSYPASSGSVGTTSANAPSPRTSPRSGLPESPFGNVPVSAADGEHRFRASAIEALGGKLEQAVGKELIQARRHINGKPREVEAGAFTTFGAHLAHAYVQAVEYADVDLIGKEKALMEVDAKLKQTARILRELEQRNTIK